MARKKQSEMKKTYGYKPTIFKVKRPKRDSFYLVVQPKGLKKL